MKVLIDEDLRQALKLASVKGGYPSPTRLINTMIKCALTPQGMVREPIQLPATHGEQLKAQAAD